MKEHKIIEKNKLIAEFMGWVHSVKDYKGINLFHYPDGDKLPIHCKNQSLEGFKYHTSYDELIPVYKRIHGIMFDKDIKADNGVDIYHEIGDSFSEDIMITWKHTVNWIEWYNKFKQIDWDK